MLDIILMVIALAVGGGDGNGGAGAGGQVAAAQGDAAPVAAAAVPAAVPAAEPQVPTGKFTTATEVRPILTATKGSWVAVRDWNGEDLLYVTHLMAWRCGLVALEIGINGAAPEPWPLPPCHEDTASPNAITAEDGVPYRGYPSGSLETLRVVITYDDLGTDSADYTRADVLMP